MDTLSLIASSFCALGMIICSLSVKDGTHFFVKNSLFLPLYFAGIVQWIYFGIYLKDYSLIIPSVLQVLFLCPVLVKWYQARINQ